MVGLDWCQTYPIPNLKIKSFGKKIKKLYIYTYIYYLLFIYLFIYFLKNVQKTHGKFGLVPNLTSRFDKLHQKIKMKVQIEPLQLSYFEPPSNLLNLPNLPNLPWT